MQPSRSAIRSLLTTLFAALAPATLAAAGGASAEWMHAHEMCCARGHIERAELRAAFADTRWEERTGRDARNYPPDRLADYQRMVLEIDIPDMNTPRFEATQRLEFTPIGAPLEALTLNAMQFDVHAVKRDGRDLTFSHDGEHLTILFNPPLAPGVETSIVTTYSVENPVDGLIWTPEHPDAPGRAAQLHTQGQPEANRYWFPAHDFPNERFATELIITVPEGYLVSGNGDLVAERTQRGRTTFHWRLEQPHVSYLVSLIVGKFEVADVARPGDPWTLPVYVPAGASEHIERTYGNTSAMMHFFERVYGEPYPWGDRYAQLVVWNFGAGGMENTGATTMYDTAILDERAVLDADLDGLIAHELAHQWFGNLLTCKSWEHIWLNEGFATYGTALWYEERDGYDDGYLASVYRSARGVAGRDRLRADDPRAGERPGMASREYEVPLDTFRRAANPYPKGATVLHMLRRELGDDLFFKAKREYVQRHKFGEVETDQLRRVIEDVSGRSFERFFEQWVIRPGAPEVRIDASWHAGAGELRLTVEQTQRIDHLVPAFVFTLPVHIETPSGWRIVEIDVSERRHERAIALDAEPTMVVVDPDLHVLMTPDVRQPGARFIAQLQSGPTIVARLDAARALRKHPGSATIEALANILTDSSEHHALRADAAASLAELRAEDALLDALRRGVDDARPRRAVMDALGVIRSSRAAEALLRHATDDAESYATRSAAIRALSRTGHDSRLEVALAALEVESQHDQVRQAALDALGRIDEAAGLDAALRFIGPGANSRTRPVAMNAVATLSRHDEQAAAEAIGPLLFDHVERVRNSATGALARIKHETAVEHLNRAAETHPHPEMRTRAQRAANRAAGLLRAGEDDDHRTELGRLSREIDRLKEMIEAKSDSED
ncbi:MAG: hypothetical protein EA379_01080 [Phycisphaerales bacterium]|nr:MAG: hypothetical protein EA379_01080 [Phycisphaerales bacterium]